MIRATDSTAKAIHFVAHQNNGSFLTLTPRYSIVKLK